MLLVLCALLSKQNPDCCWPSKVYLEERLGVAEITVKRQLKKLRQTGYISRPVANSGRKPGAIFIHFDVLVPVEFCRHVPKGNGQIGMAGGITDDTPNPVSGDHSCTPREVRGDHQCTPQDVIEDANDTPELPRGDHSCTPQEARGYHSSSVRGDHSCTPGSIKGFITGGEARAHVHVPAREPDPSAQPPPDEIDDHVKIDGSDTPAKEPIPDVLPDAWAKIARTEFVGVDERHQSGNTKLDRSFVRFQTLSPNRDDRKTPEDWLKAWKVWLLDDFPIVVNGHANGSAADGNSHDPPTAPVIREKWQDFKHLLESKYRKVVEKQPGNLQLTRRRDLILDDRRKLRTQAIKIAEGKLSPPFGLEGGPMWGWPEIYHLLQGFDGFVSKTCPETATQTED